MILTFGPSGRRGFPASLAAWVSGSPCDFAQILRRRPVLAAPTSIEKIPLDLSRLVQNGAGQDKARLLGVKHGVRLKEEATKTGGDLVHGPPDARKAGKQVERALQPCVVGVGLIGAEGFLGVLVNLDKVAFRPL